VIVYAVVDNALSPGFSLGDAVEIFVRRAPAYALATTSRTSALSNVTPSGTLAPIRSAAVRAASSDSNTIIERPLLPSSDRVQ
jgi:hypothetical protein